jgi:hypothetical protein
VRPHWDFRRCLSPRVAAALSDEQRRLLGFSAAPRFYDPWSDRVFQGEGPGRIARWRMALRRLLLGS